MHNGISSGGNGGGGSCQVSCKSNGGCEVRKGGNKGSCFSPAFGGECFGLPSGCGSCVSECNKK